MILWGCCIPFGWAFSAYRYFAFSDFLLLNIGTFTKNWRMTLVGIYFYFYPFGVMALSEVMHWDNHWFIAGSLLLGLILLHVMLTKLYQHMVSDVRFSGMSFRSHLHCLLLSYQAV